MKQDRMFHVLVLGGIALVGGGCGSTRRVEFPPPDATAADGSSDAGSDADASFPSELPAYLDAATEAGDALPFVGEAGFPVEVH